MIAFKQIISIDEWSHMHQMLRTILWWVEQRWKGTMVITRISQPPVDGESGIHHSRPRLRAADLRTWRMTVAEGLAKAQEINREWQYDPRRPRMRVAMFHKTKKGAWHMHLQVHPRTRRR